jgi:glycerol-3-phosphate cytidylyltransferase-like family protein
VDTRSKIVNVTEAPPGGVLVVGCFDVPGVEHVRALREIRACTPGAVIAAVLPNGDVPPKEVLDQRGRAEMAAAQRMVDYVLIAARTGYPGDLQELITRLRPAAIIRLDETEQGRMRRLIAQVQHGQTV